ncbi:MAG: 4-hydroxythreonine-4-phosphate dehydrogenase [Flaviaesturariibacter sp.]|nr:4-hydroxythreonine-4-phosphate dehydrogenase [Flaviaesturariibacter sp.]
MQKPVIGITCGDLNGIGMELILKTFSDHRLIDRCTPVIFGSQKLINFYKKTIPELVLNVTVVTDLTQLNHKQVNVVNCWEDEVEIKPGELTEAGGKYAVLALKAAVKAVQEGHLHGIVTAPIHKKNVQSADFNHSGHTPFLKEATAMRDVLMLLYADQIRVALVTEHLPVKDVAQQLTKQAIISKMKLLTQSLRRDFGIDRPKVAVLGLNPHAGDEGLIGNEEETIIKPAIKDAKQHNVLAFGPYSADAFFARQSYLQFDAVLAMYHDQGLIPFKTIASGEGVNFTAGLPFVRTSPDHGTAFDIAGRNLADATSFTTAVFECVAIINHREEYDERTSNPLRKITGEILKNVEDERIDETIG